MEAMHGFEEIASLTVDAVKAAVLAVRLRKAYVPAGGSDRG